MQSYIELLITDEEIKAEKRQEYLFEERYLKALLGCPFTVTVSDSVYTEEGFNSFGKEPKPECPLNFS